MKELTIKEQKFINQIENSDEWEHQKIKRLSNTDMKVWMERDPQKAKIGKKYRELKLKERQTGKVKVPQKKKEEPKGKTFDQLIQMEEDDVRKLYNDSKIPEELYRRTIKWRFNQLFED